ncbi:hypothetical protein JXA80_02635 [bacterium]|nr:hypothetical protein [candidate division CSSED10-310 bacterium]
MKWTIRLIICAIASFTLVTALTGCGDKPAVEVSVAPVTPSHSTFAITRLTANLLTRKPTHEMDKPDVLMMINQGDQIAPIQEDGNWTQVQHILTGNIGWLHKSFVQIEQRSKWWSADTDRARRCAEKIYQDKVFMEKNWPIAHVSIEERWNKLVFTTREGQSFDRNQAVECASFGLKQLRFHFPDWKDHQVFLNGSTGTEPFTLVLADDGKPTFL